MPLTTIKVIFILAYTFPYINSKLLDEEFIRSFLSFFAERSHLHDLLGLCSYISCCILIPILYVSLVFLACSFLVFKSMNKFCSFKRFGIDYENGLSSEFKFIAIWMLTYGAINLTLHFLGIDDVVYYQLTYLAQFLSFYTMVRKQKYGFRIVPQAN